MFSIRSHKKQINAQGAVTEKVTHDDVSACMLICHKGHTDTIQVYSVTVMTHVKALQAGHSSQGTSEPITPDANL